MLRPLRVSQPTTVAEASAELARLGEEAKVYAGGTELILLLRLGLIHQAQRHYEAIVQPVDDLHGSAAYKTCLTGVLLGRALTQAVGAHGR